jgi:hypothetical protein
VPLSNRPTDEAMGTIFDRLRAVSAEMQTLRTPASTAPWWSGLAAERLIRKVR